MKLKLCQPSESHLCSNWTSRNVLSECFTTIQAVSFSLHALQNDRLGTLNRIFSRYFVWIVLQFFHWRDQWTNQLYTVWDLLNGLVGMHCKFTLRWQITFTNCTKMMASFSFMLYSGKWYIIKLWSTQSCFNLLDISQPLTRKRRRTIGFMRNSFTNPSSWYMCSRRHSI